MAKAILNVLINCLATLIQIPLIPINLAISSALPDLSDKILEVTSLLSDIFDSMAWALGILPPTIVTVLLFVVTCEIAKHTIFISTHTLVKVWNLMQKIKFW